MRTVKEKSDNIYRWKMYIKNNKNNIPVRIEYSLYWDSIRLAL